MTRAAALHDTGDYDEAIRAIDQALALDASSESREFRQRIVDAQNFERALRSTDDALTLQQVEPALKIVSLRRLDGLVRERGTTFILDGEGERRLRAAIPADKVDAALVDEVLLLLSPPKNPSLRTEWVAPTDRRRMTWIPAGSFQMGSPGTESGHESDETVHPVTIAAGFWMESTEVTYRAFQRFVLANPEWQKNRIDRRFHDGNYLADWNGNDIPSGRDDAPVINVSWYAARAYAAWAGKRLPTEAQWEYACRAGSRSAYWWGDAFGAAPSGAVTGGAVRNPWGLIAMLGGVWEWTASLYRDYPYTDDGRNNAAAPGERVTRGGFRTNGGNILRSANRNRVLPHTCNDLLGFRCVF